MKQLIIIIPILLSVLFSFSSLTLAADTAGGAEIFNLHCVACHDKGGNVVRRGKNLKQKALIRNHMDSIGAIASLVETGKNAMPAFQDRLSKTQIEAVSAYVLEQAANNWH